MSDTLEDLEKEYISALLEYLAGSGEEGLRHAYELGRNAIAGGLGVLEISAAHQKVLASILARNETPSAREAALESASQFFSETLSPFEMALRGFQEANTALRRNLDELLAAEEELFQQNQKLAEAHQAVEAERQRYRELFEFAPDGYLVTDLEGTILDANGAAAALFRTRKDALEQTPLLVFITPDEQAPFRTLLEQLRRGVVESAQDYEFRMRPESGPTFPVALTASLIHKAGKQPAGVRWLLRDITERKRVEEERALLQIRERVARAEADAARRLEFLAEASKVLAAALDYETAFANASRLIVPYLADWCMVHVVEENGLVRRLPGEPGSLDPELLRRYEEQHSPESPPPDCILRVIRTGQSQLVPLITDSWLLTFACDHEDLSLLREMKLGSALLVPLTVHVRAIGCIALFTADPDRRYTPADLVLAEDLAHRCALALDKARLYRQVTVERDRAEKASRAKDEFVAILSHELRNPLMPILGWGRVFKAHDAVTNDALLGEGVRSIERNARNIERIVEDCLDLARISERKITLDRELVDLNQITEAAIEAVREQAHAKELKLVVQLSPSRLWIWGDRTRLQQVVMNLLTNAVRYTGNGGLVSISSQGAAQMGEVRVQDTGVGIAADFLQQIFEPFRQGTKSWLTSDSGLGLGLAVVQQIVDMHGGQVTAESAGPGCGSTFCVRLPLHAGQPAAAAATPPKIASPAVTATPEAAARPVHVLVIEDSRDILSLMKIELEALGYVVHTAVDGKSGLETALRLQPDIIVSDIRMPGMDGYELIRKIRGTPGLDSVPAVALTGFGMKKDIEKAMEAGYNAHLIKPVDTNELSALIQDLTQPRMTQITQTDRN